MKRALIIAILFVGLSTVVSAHQPRLVIGTPEPIPVTEPEISKAYYDELAGTPRIYRIISDKPFVLFVRITVPKSSNPDGRYEATIYRLGTNRELVGRILSAYSSWAPLYEPFGGDTYQQSAEFKQRVEAGMFDIEISGNGGRGKYVLAVGHVESFTLGEIWSAVRLIPQLKQDFFQVSPLTFAASIFGSVYLAIMLLLGMLAGFVYRLVVKRKAKGAPRGIARNIGKKDRWVRVGIGVILLGWGTLTTWSPFVLIAAGFCFFEAIFSWCAFYAALGKNTCSVE